MVDGLNALRAALREFLALETPPEACELSLGTSVQEAGFGRRAVTFASAGGEPIEAFLFEPVQPASSTAVLVLHQHNSQWELGKSEVAGLAGDPLQAFGPALARRGITVLSADAVGFESRRRTPGGGVELGPRLSKPYGTPEGWLQYYNQAMHRLVRGRLLMTDLLSDVQRAVSGLLALPQIERVGVLGHSHGGTVALFAAALDTRLGFGCVSGAACSFRYKLARGIALDMALVLPGFAERFDLDDLMRCVAPRPLFVVSADQDVYSADAPDLVRRAAPTFAAMGATEALRLLHVQGRHALDSERFEAILAWLEERARA